MRSLVHFADRSHCPVRLIEILHSSRCLKRRPQSGQLLSVPRGNTPSPLPNCLEPIDEGLPIPTISKNAMLCMKYLQVGSRPHRAASTHVSTPARRRLTGTDTTRYNDPQLHFPLETPATPGLGSISHSERLGWSVAKRSRNSHRWANYGGPSPQSGPDTGHGFDNRVMHNLSRVMLSFFFISFFF